MPRARVEGASSVRGARVEASRLLGAAEGPPSQVQGRLGDLMSTVVGADVNLTLKSGPRLRGRVLLVSKKSVAVGDAVTEEFDKIHVLDAAGAIRSAPLEDVEAYGFVDEAVRARLAEALEARVHGRAKRRGEAITVEVSGGGGEVKASLLAPGRAREPGRTSNPFRGRLALFRRRSLDARRGEAERIRLGQE